MTTLPLSFEPSRAYGYRIPEPIKADFKGYTFRAIGSRLFYRPEKETFHEFLIEIPLKWVMSKPWWDGERVKGESYQHIVFRWLREWYELQKQSVPMEWDGKTPFSSDATGNALALLTLAYDLYHLQRFGKLPHDLVERLRDRNAFQGAKYEVAVAACFARGGFEIQWIKEKAKKHAEFNAIHLYSKDIISVEAKSRHRPGIIHQSGTAELEKAKADLKDLYLDSLAHAPGDRPFTIFLDVNLPHTPEVPHVEKEWFDEVQQMLYQVQQPSSYAPLPFIELTITNFSWHYEGNNPATTGESMVIRPAFSTHIPKDPNVMNGVHEALQKYGSVPNNE